MDTIISQPKILHSKERNFYGKEYEQMLSSIKDLENKAKEYFKEIQSKLNEKFVEFNSNLVQYFQNLTNKFSKIFGINNEEIDKRKMKFIQGITKKYIDKIIKIKNLNEQILEGVKSGISIFFDSFDITKDLKNDNLVNRFLDKEFDNIINSWLFLKIDFRNYNMIKTLNNTNIEEEYKAYIYKYCKNKTFITNINPPKMKNENDNSFIYQDMDGECTKYFLETYLEQTSIKINDIKNVDKQFKSTDDYPKLKKLKFKNCIFSTKESKNSLIKRCPNLEKLILNGTYNFELKMLENLSHNITKLILANNNFINTDFNNIMNKYIINSDFLREKLEYLSFSNNNLTNIKLNGKINKFYSLKEIDFHKNKIYKISGDDLNFNDMKCINCCYNKFSRAELWRHNNIIALFSGNLFLTDSLQCENYYNNLQTKLTDNKASLTILSISFLKGTFAEQYLGNIVIDYTILSNIRKLDLSYNELTCDTLFKFFNNNISLINLKVLNLTGNKLNDLFFEKYINNDYHIIFTKLQKINLNNNLIGDQSKITLDELGEEPEGENDKKQIIYKLRLIYKFIEKNKHLSKLCLSKNPLKEKLDIQNIDISRVDFGIKRDEQNNIIIDSFYSFLKKIENELLMNKEEKENRSHFIIKFNIENMPELNMENININ